MQQARTDGRPRTASLHLLPTTHQRISQGHIATHSRLPVATGPQPTPSAVVTLFSCATRHYLAETSGPWHRGAPIQNTSAPGRGARRPVGSNIRHKAHRVCHRIIFRRPDASSRHWRRTLMRQTKNSTLSGTQPAPEGYVGYVTAGAVLCS